MASSLAAYCFLILYCILHKVAESTLEIPRSTQREVGFLCSRGCNKLDDQHNDTDIPLYQCSCSPSCSVYGDCCFDSPHRDITVRRKRHFICLSVVGHDRYRAVSSCPSDQPAEFCKDGLGHVPPVTSRVTNITYANVFCARCNGENEDLIIWNVELRCSSNVNTGAEAKYIYRHGNIWSFNKANESKALCKYHIHYNDSSFIGSSELRSCTGNVRKIYRCSSSWKDKSVAEMCRSYEDPVYFHNTAFRNAHCAMCNYQNPEFANCVPSHVKNIMEKGVVNQRVKRFCKTRGAFACTHSLTNIRAKGRNYDFANLLNIYERGCIPPKWRRCCLGEAYHFRTKRCRKTWI